VRVLVVSGIFPPDIGGPATHADDVRAELRTRGHEVVVLSLSDAPSPSATNDVVVFPRRWSWPVRSSRAIGWLIRNRKRFDVVYATGLAPVAVAGARLARRPVVLKIVGDPAWERGSRLGLTDATFDRFQGSRGGAPTLRAMRWLRNWSTRRATAVVTPSDHLRHAVSRWGDRSDVVVVPNGVRPVVDANARAGGAAGQLSLVFLGRLVPVKRVELLIEGTARVDGVFLEVIGDGPEMSRLQTLAHTLGVDDRVTFTGAVAHDDARRRVAAADALVLASSHEGLPHVVLEALASGTPIVTSATAGVAEVVTDGVDALVVADATARDFGTAFARLAADPSLQIRLRAGAWETGRLWSLDRCVDRIEGLLREVASDGTRAVFVGKSRAQFPLTRDDEMKYEIHARHLSTDVVCTGSRARVQRLPGARVITIPSPPPPILATALFYTAGPLVALALATGRRRRAIVCQSPFEGFSVLLLRTLLPPRVRPRVQIELHGDWRTASRMYGSPRRRIVGPAADAVATWALRRADRVRVVSAWLEGLAREAGYPGPIDHFIAFSDYGAFLDEAPEDLPGDAHALFVGVFERYKAVDVLLDAWRDVIEELPTARLSMVGSGSLEAALRARIAAEGLGASVQLIAPVKRPELRALVDQATCLVLPSRSEGLGRIILEAMGRGRPVVASRVGGIVELVDDGRTGRLVEPQDAPALARAIVELLGDPELTSRMGEEARRRALARDPLCEYESGIARLATWIDTP
jgi:glycosyltransferase involved in cell wall biosynthesis